MDKTGGAGGPQKSKYIFLEEAHAKAEIKRHASTLFAGKDLSWWALATNLGFTRLLESWFNPDYAKFVEEAFQESKKVPSANADALDQTAEKIRDKNTLRTKFLDTTENSLLDGLPRLGDLTLEIARNRNKYEGPYVSILSQELTKIPENFAKDLIISVLTTARQSGPDALDQAITKLKENLEKPQFQSPKETLTKTIDRQARKLNAELKEQAQKAPEQLTTQEKVENLEPEPKIENEPQNPTPATPSPPTLEEQTPTPIAPNNVTPSPAQQEEEQRMLLNNEFIGLAEDLNLDSNNEITIKYNKIGLSENKLSRYYNETRAPDSPPPPQLKDFVHNLIMDLFEKAKQESKMATSLSTEPLSNEISVCELYDFVTANPLNEHLSDFEKNEIIKFCESELYFETKKQDLTPPKTPAPLKMDIFGKGYTLQEARKLRQVALMERKQKSFTRDIDRIRRELNSKGITTPEAQNEFLKNHGISTEGPGLPSRMAIMNAYNEAYELPTKP